MSPSTITLLFLLFAVVMFVFEKIPLGLYINDRVLRSDRCYGVFGHSGGLFTGFSAATLFFIICSNVYCRWRIVETGIARTKSRVVTKFAKVKNNARIVTIVVIVDL